MTQALFNQSSKEARIREDLIQLTRAELALSAQREQESMVVSLQQILATDAQADSATRALLRAAPNMANPQLTMEYVVAACDSVLRTYSHILDQGPVALASLQNEIPLLLWRFVEWSYLWARAAACQYINIEQRVATLIGQAWGYAHQFGRAHTAGLAYQYAPQWSVQVTYGSALARLAMFQRLRPQELSIGQLAEVGEALDNYAKAFALQRKLRSTRSFFLDLETGITGLIHRDGASPPGVWFVDLIEFSDARAYSRLSLGYSSRQQEEYELQREYGVLGLLERAVRRPRFPFESWHGGNEKMVSVVMGHMNVLSVCQRPNEAATHPAAFYSNATMANSDNMTVVHAKTVSSRPSIGALVSMECDGAVSLCILRFIHRENIRCAEVELGLEELAQHNMVSVVKNETLGGTAETEDRHSTVLVLTNSLIAGRRYSCVLPSDVTLRRGICCLQGKMWRISEPLVIESCGDCEVVSYHFELCPTLAGRS